MREEGGTAGVYFNPFLKKRQQSFLSHWKPVQMRLLKQTLYCELLGKGQDKDLDK